ncbi:MAG: hypothetical protein KAH95_06180, partial [Spirochaetales bacterium]|nr:hypothetical protein [Spirochaetales bacterium]
YIDGKTVEVKNFAIELDVHQETGKAILNRINKAEEHLESKAAYIEKMYERINEYDKALNELTQMTGRVQDNLDRLHEESEFVDKVGKRVKEAGLGILKLEKEIPGLKHEFAKENIKELKLVRTVVLKDTQKVVSHIKNELDSGEKMIKTFGSTVGELEKTRDLMKKETVESIQNFLDEQVYKSEQASEQLTSELTDRFDVIFSRKSEEAETIEADLKKTFERSSDHFMSIINEAEEKVSQFKDQIRIVEAAYTKSLGTAVERGKTLEDEAFDSIRQKITSDVENLKTEYEQSLGEMNNSVSAKISDFGTAYVEISDKNKEILEKLSKEIISSDKSVRDRVSGVESRVHEYEDSINYKFTKIESISSDMDSLDKNLRISMEQTEKNIKADFLGYAKQQDQIQIDYRQKISEEMKELDNGLNSLELELNGLKTRAYENVAKGLKV